MSAADRRPDETPRRPTGGRLRRQLLLLLLSTALLSTLATAALLLVSEYIRDRRTFEARHEALVSTVANFASLALAAGSEGDLHLAVEAVSGFEAVRAALIYGPGGTVLASISRRPGALPPAPESFEGLVQRENELVVSAPIRSRSGTVGHVVLYVSLLPLHQAALLRGLQVAAVLGVVLLSTGLIAQRLQRQIAQPLVDLAETIRQVSESSDYSVRLDSDREDELGQLTRGFNELLARIHQRELQQRDADERTMRYAAELARNETRLKRQQAGLVRLAGYGVATHDDDVRNFTEVVAAALNVQRVRIWIVADDERTLRCADAFDDDQGHSLTEPLAAERCPALVDALRQGRRLVVADVATEAIAGEYAACLQSLDGTVLTSLLLVPLRISGTRFGALCIEHAGPPRTWMADEETFAVAVAEMITLHFEEAERRRAEQALRTSEQRFRLLAEASPVGIFLTDPEGRIVYANRRLDDLLGRQTRDQPVDLVLGRTILGADREAFARAWSRARQEQAEFLVDVRIRQPSGELRYLHMRGADLRDGAQKGRYLGHVVVVEDATERHLRAAQIRRLNEELEQRVRDRTAALEAANRELEAFSYSVSHDLRAPLRSIDGFSQAILEDYYDQLDRDGQDFLRRIRAATQRMGRLIDDLLKLSRVTRVEMNRTDLDLSAMVREIASQLSENQGDRVIRWEIEEGVRARGDGPLVRVALTNLLSNAVKYTGRRDEAVIQFGQMITAEGERRFFVRDNGAGFDMRFAGKLFVAFQRLHADTDFEGTGVGLATVLRVIRRHGGSVWAEGKVDEYACFSFTLGDAAPAAEASPENRLEKSEPVIG